MPRRLAAPAQRDRLVLAPAPGLLLARALERPRRGEHAPVGLLGQLAQPRGLVDRVADHRVLEARLRAHVAGHRAARGHADPGLEPLEAGPDPLRQRAPGGERAARGVVERQRRAEHGQRRVALELVDPAAVVLDDLDDDAEELVELGDDLLRRALGRHRGRADEVDEQHGDLELLAAELDPALLGGAGDVLADVAAEQVAQLLALAQPVAHPVEAGLEQAEVASRRRPARGRRGRRPRRARARRAPSAPGRRPRAPTAT